MSDVKLLKVFDNHSSDRGLHCYGSEGMTFDVRQMLGIGARPFILGRPQSTEE